MKRFLVFGGENYYPDGGMRDFKMDFDTLSEAVEYAKNELEKDLYTDWAEVWDCEKRKIVYDSSE